MAKSTAFGSWLSPQTTEASVVYDAAGQAKTEIPPVQEALFPDLSLQQLRDIYARWQEIERGLARHLHTPLMDYASHVATASGASIDSLLILPERVLRKMKPFARTSRTKAPALGLQTSLLQSLGGRSSAAEEDPGAPASSSTPPVTAQSSEQDATPVKSENVQQRKRSQTSARVRTSWGVPSSAVPTLLENMNVSLLKQRVERHFAFQEAEEALYLAIVSESGPQDNPLTTPRLRAWEQRTLSYVKASPRYGQHLAPAEAHHFVSDTQTRAVFGTLVGIVGLKFFLNSSSGHLNRAVDDVQRMYREQMMLVQACELVRRGGRLVATYSPRRYQAMQDFRNVDGPPPSFGDSPRTSVPYSQLRLIQRTL